MEHSSDEFAEAFLTKLDCRYIYRHRHRRKTFILPFPGLRTGGPEHPFANWHDQAAVLGNSYELIGRHETQVRILPTKSDAGAQDRGHYFDTLEERRTFRRRTTENASSLSIEQNPGDVQVFMPRRWPIRSCDAR